MGENISKINSIASSLIIIWMRCLLVTDRLQVSEARLARAEERAQQLDGRLRNAFVSNEDRLIDGHIVEYI